MLFLACCRGDTDRSSSPTGRADSEGLTPPNIDRGKVYVERSTWKGPSAAKAAQPHVQSSDDAMMQWLSEDSEALRDSQHHEHIDLDEPPLPAPSPPVRSLQTEGRSIYYSSGGRGGEGSSLPTVAELGLGLTDNTNVQRKQEKSELASPTSPLKGLGQSMGWEEGGAGQGGGEVTRKQQRLPQSLDCHRANLAGVKSLNGSHASSSRSIDMERVPGTTAGSTTKQRHRPLNPRTASLSGHLTSLHPPAIPPASSSASTSPLPKPHPKSAYVAGSTSKNGQPGVGGHHPTTPDRFGNSTLGPRTLAMLNTINAGVFSKDRAPSTPLSGSRGGFLNQLNSRPGRNPDYRRMSIDPRSPNGTSSPLSLDRRKSSAFGAQDFTRAVTGGLLLAECARVTPPRSGQRIPVSGQLSTSDKPSSPLAHSIQAQADV